MAYAMTKQGSLDNCITYEFMCDTVADMNAIENRYRTIGTVAIVLSGESGMEVYIAGSDKQWNSLSSIGGSNAGGNTAGLAIHICTQNEVSNGLPDVELPDETTIYLVPASDASSGNLYDEYIYVDEEWEKFGSASIDLSGYYQKPVSGIPASDLASGVIPDVSGFAPKESPIFTGSISLGRAANSAIGTNSIAIGENVTASNDQAHAEGRDTTASGQYSHAEGIGGVFTINNTTYTSEAKGTSDHTEGFKTRTSAGQPGNHAEGYQTSAIGGASHAEGNATTASGNSSHAEGSSTIASMFAAHAEGNHTQASGTYAHTEGNNTTASGTNAHAEGEYTTAGGTAAHAEGSSTTASGTYSHAEGNNTIASNIYTHAEGSDTTASGVNAHAEGQGTTASGTTSHAEGRQTVASGALSHTEGWGTIANLAAMHTGGQYNAIYPDWISGTSYEVDDLRVYNSILYKCTTANSDTTFNSSKWLDQSNIRPIFVIGNGSQDDSRSNACTINTDGNEYLMGDIYVGCNADSTGGTKLPRIPEAPSADGTYILQATVTNGTPTYTWVSLSSLSGVTF